MSRGRRPNTSERTDIFSEHAHRLTLPVLLVRDAHHMVAGDRNDAFTAPVVSFLQRL